jgi:hypothetical protein
MSDVDLADLRIDQQDPRPGVFEPDLTRAAVLEQHPLAWLVEVGDLIVDARMLPPELQDEARRRGLISDLGAHRVA